MDERFSCISLTDGEAGVTLGALYRYFTSLPQGMTIVYVTVSPSVDDADLTIDINDDGTVAIAAISCADKDVPGTWKSVDVGGSNAPVAVAADSVMSLDANSAAAGTRVHVQIWVKI